MGKCHFQDIWLQKKKYKDWLVKDVKDINSARCSVCRRSFVNATMGEYALRNHGSCAKHLELMKMRSSEAGKYFSINESCLQIVFFITY